MSHPHAEAWSSPQARYLGLSDEEMGLPAAAADAASEDGASDGRQSAVMHPVSIDSSIDGTGRRSAEDEPLIATQCNGVLHDSLPFTQPLAARDKLCMSAACVMVLAVLATVGTAVGLRMEAESRLDAMLHLLRGATFEPGINGTWKMQVTPEQADEYDMRDAEVTLLGTLHVRIANRSMYMTEQLLRGAHVVVRGDGGYFYRMFSRFEGAYTRTSSHYSSRVQYGIPEGRYLRTLLFGTVRPFVHRDAASLQPRQAHPLAARAPQWLIACR